MRDRAAIEQGSIRSRCWSIGHLKPGTMYRLYGSAEPVLLQNDRTGIVTRTYVCPAQSSTNDFTAAIHVGRVNVFPSIAFHYNAQTACNDYRQGLCK